MKAAAAPELNPPWPAAYSVRPTSPHPTNDFVRFEKADIEQTLSERFEQQVRQFPEKLSIRTTRGSLTYAQLNAQANRISHLILANRGSGKEPVALLFGQGALLIAAIVGSVKAGKIYVPLDPLIPAERNADILIDSTAVIILTDTANLDNAQALASRDVLVLNVDTMGDDHSAENPDLDLAPDGLTYIFYTSGSTGKPKGLADTHRNVLHNIMRYTNSLHICSEDRLTLLQSASFSGSVSSLFGALLNGATSFPFSLQHEGPGRLASWVSQEGITIYHSVPSIFRLLALGKQSYPALRIIRLEGDQATPKDIELYKVHFPDTCILVNGLGATECGIVRQYFVNKDTPTPDNVVPIGFPVEDMEVVLLDQSGQQVGPDSVGEIAVRSCYLAPGYWRRPDLTKAVFLTDSRGGSQRMYRTGDLGRMRVGGCLEYLGRQNFQSRIRGQWVEIAEVEKALRQVAALKDVVVLTVEGISSEPKLVAYLVPGESPPPGIEELRRQLAQRLPVHMVPTAFVLLDALPLNPYGKVDRRALPAPNQERPNLKENYVAPQDMLQLLLQQIWEEVLQIRPVGIRDNFFDLGGDSLRAVNMILNVEQKIGAAIRPEFLLTRPTIQHLARSIGDQSGGSDVPILEIQRGTAARAFYFLHGGYLSGGHYCVNLARYLGSDRPFYALPPCGTNGYAVPDSYEDMAKLHIGILRAKQPVGPYLLGGTCNGGLVAYEMARRLVAEGEKVDALILIAASAANLRFAFLRQLVSPLRIISKRAELRTFVALQPYWRLLARLSLLQWPGFSFSGLPRAWGQFRNSVLRRRRGGQDLSVHVDTRIEDKTAMSFRASLRGTYLRIDKEYTPGRYPGRVIIFWAIGEDESPEEAARWWSKVAGQVELHTIPGRGHDIALTEHVEAVAETLRSCLDAVG
jgi:amino acid adenylation domain-containing protein